MMIRDEDKISRIGDHLGCIDKTSYILRLLSLPYDSIFLSRPRGFGKTLLLDTLSKIFLGKKELFKGLFIYDKWDFEPFPVLRINLQGIDGSSYETFKTSMHFYFERVVAPSLGLDIEYSPSIPSSYLANTLLALYRKSGKRMVVLIDDWDYPVMGKKVDRRIEGVLRDFFVAIKNHESLIRFSLITGVFPFSSFSITGGLNNIEDISAYKSLSLLLSFSEEELAPYCDSETLRKLSLYYGEYSFSPNSVTRVLNPFSISKFFNLGRVYESFWCKEYSADLRSFSSALNKDHPWVISKYDVSDPSDPYAFLLFSGYLTILREEDGMYLLDYPNREVSDYLRKEVECSY